MPIKMTHDGPTSSPVGWKTSPLQPFRKKLQESGLDSDDINCLLYFQSHFFRECVPRVRLPPSRLYWPVRAVFVTFGNMKDPATNQPFFNKEAWNKANSILSEVLQGYHSDPPGVATFEYLYEEDWCIGWPRISLCTFGFTMKSINTPRLK